MKKISVVISAYNEEKSLPNCLDAVTNQSFPRQDYEIVVVDNNSKDKTAEIAKSYGARVIKEPRQGNTYAVSTGLNNAQGQIIASTDSDTVVFHNWLEVIYKAFEDKQVVGATGSTYVKSNNKLFVLFSLKFYEYFLKFNFLIGKAHFSGFNFAVRKSVYDEIGGVNEKFIMSPDVDLGLRMSKKGKILFLNKMAVTTSYRRWHDNPLDAAYTYAKGYIWSVWLRKPPPVKQTVVR